MLKWNCPEKSVLGPLDSFLVPVMQSGCCCFEFLKHWGLVRETGGPEDISNIFSIVFHFAFLVENVPRNMCAAVRGTNVRGKRERMWGSRAAENAVNRADPSRGSQGGSASRTPVWKPWPGMSGQHRNVTRRVSLAQGRPWTGVSWRNLHRRFTATISRVTSACVAPRYARG